MITEMTWIRAIRRHFAEHREARDRLRAFPLLTCLDGPSKGEETYVETVPLTIGQGFNCQFVVNDARIASCHAVISRNKLGFYALRSVNPDTAPVLVRRAGRYVPVGNVTLRPGDRFRLGRGGPRIRFRFLGVIETRTHPLGVQSRDRLLPDRHVRSKLDQIWKESNIEQQDRLFVYQAARYLGKLGSYRRWLFRGALVLLLFSGLLVYGGLRNRVLKTELETTRATVAQGWSTLGKAEAAAEPEEGSPVEQKEQALSNLLEGDRIARMMEDVLLASGVEHPQLSLELVNQVKSEIDLEVSRLRLDFDVDQFLESHDRYHPRIEAVFQREFQLPPVLAYVAWLESSYQLDAESLNGAMGMWQFTEPVARQYQLITDEGEDYRLDFEASTRAAGQRLADLIAEFGLEHLMVALAANHWGPENVNRLIRHHRFWKPSQRYFANIARLTYAGDDMALPEETVRYVARFFAIYAIATNRTFYLSQ